VLIICGPLVEEFGIEVVGAGSAGLVDGLVGLAEHGDDLAGPFLPIRVEFEHACAVADDVRAALLHSGQVRVELVPAGVVVAHQIQRLNG
jgi:hypothetical protein